MDTYIVVAVASFVAALLFIGYQARKAWTQRRRWAWVNIALMLVVLIGTMGMAAAAELTNTRLADQPVDMVAAVTYVTAMAGVVFWVLGGFGGEFIYLLTERLDTRRTERSEEV